MVLIETQIESVRKLLSELNGGFLSRSGTDFTSWDCCHDCGKADWEGHSNKCEFNKLLKEVENTFSNS